MFAEQDLKSSQRGKYNPMVFGNDLSKTPSKKLLLRLQTFGYYLDHGFGQARSFADSRSCTVHIIAVYTAHSFDTFTNNHIPGT